METERDTHRMPHWLKEGLDLLPFEQRAQRILIVADGALTFDVNSDKGLSIFVEELAKVTPPPVITRAHRRSEPTADKPGFVFDASVSTANYDQVWLFGYEAGDITGESVLKDEEFKVLAEFMMAGGGVFATGDHEKLGFAMGGELFRVRKMRDWKSIPMIEERIDTVTNPGPDRKGQFFDQADEFPQRIFPHYYGSGNSWSPHPLLSSSVGDIDVMPDHPHESVCLEGTDLADPYTLHGLNLVEFPLKDGVPLAPEIIATSVSAGRFLTDKPIKKPTTPRCFGSISVWNGHEVGQGRIVCDSTWHHFVNLNLIGAGAPDQPGSKRTGFYDPVTKQFTPDFHQIAQYYRNIAEWLTPPTRRWSHWWIQLLIERYRFPLVEEWRPLPSHTCPWEPRVQLGEIVEEALRINRGQGCAEELVMEALDIAELEKLAALVRPAPTEVQIDRLLQPVNVDDLRRGVLGSIFDAFARELPSCPSDLAGALKAKKPDHALLVEKATMAVGGAVDAALTFYEESMKRTRLFVEQMMALRAEQLTSESEELKQDYLEDKSSE